MPRRAAATLTSPIVADPAARDRLAAAAEGCDYLVNAAGIILLKPIFEVTVEDWRRVQTVNAESIFFLCQKIGPRMHPGGAIVNLSSSSAKLATTVEVAVYAASKTIDPVDHALFRLCARRRARCGSMRSAPASSTRRCRTRSSRMWRRCAAPPSRNSSAGAQQGGAARPRRARRRNAPALIWFLLSDEAAYMTGQAINFTGGMVHLVR